MILFQVLISIFYLLFFGISLKKPIWAIQFIVFLLPTYLIKFNLGLVPTNLLEGMIILLFLSQLSKLNIRKISQIITQRKLLFSGVFLLFFGLIISTFFSNNSITSLGILKSWFIVPMIFSLIISHQTNKKSAPIIFDSLALSGVTISIIAVIYFILGETTYDGRIAAFFNHPNFLAMYLSPCFIISFSNILKNPYRRYRLYWFLSSILIIFTTLLTQSIGTLVSIIIASITYLVLTKHITRKNKFHLCLGFFLLVVFSIGMLSPKIDILFTTNRSSMHSRIIIWQSATKILKDNWLIGIGAGNFQSYYLDYQKYFPPYLEWSSPQPHNIFLAFWIQLGVSGFLGFLLMLIWFYKSGITILKKEALSATLIAIMSVVLIHGLTDTTYWKNDLSIVFWLLIALMILISRNHYGTDYKLRE